jgi:hypothetical protein
MSGAWARDDARSFAIAMQRMASGRTELLRDTTPCDECHGTPADPAPLMTGRPEGVLCERCWWRLNMRGSR